MPMLAKNKIGVGDASHMVGLHIRMIGEPALPVVLVA
jgi:hypothetical protein